MSSELRSPAVSWPHEQRLRGVIASKRRNHPQLNRLGSEERVRRPSTAYPQGRCDSGWLGRYLDGLARPVDPLVGWNTVGELPATLRAASVEVPSIPDPKTYAFRGPNGDNDVASSKTAAWSMASHTPVRRPHLALVHATALAALATGVGSRVFGVQTGGYDTHAGQNPVSGQYARLMTVLNNALAAFSTDLVSHDLWNQTLTPQFSECGRTISENGSRGTDHGAAGLMLALGGGVLGGLYGTAGSLASTPDNPATERLGRDVALVHNSILG